MRGKSVRYGGFVLHPEYSGLSPYELAQASLDGTFQVASLLGGGSNRGVVYHLGKLVWERTKYRLYESEVGLVKGDRAPLAVELGSANVLLLICYELMFPQDYLLQNKGKVDLVLHMVGVPMFSEDQREGWVALQRVLALVYECPVVCCCGGRRGGRMNISGVTYSDEE